MRRKESRLTLKSPERVCWDVSYCKWSEFALKILETQQTRNSMKSFWKAELHISPEFHSALILYWHLLVFNKESNVFFQICVPYRRSILGGQWWQFSFFIVTCNLIAYGQSPGQCLYERGYIDMPSFWGAYGVTMWTPTYPFPIQALPLGHSASISNLKPSKYLHNTLNSSDWNCDPKHPHIFGQWFWNLPSTTALNFIIRTSLSNGQNQDTDSL